MSEHKHTPGPWAAHHRIDLITKAEAAIYGPDGDMVAMVYGNLGLDGDPMATSRLIAAAPALLDALEAAVAQYAGYPPEVLAEIAPEWLDVARKAIEKVRIEE